MRSKDSVVRFTLRCWQSNLQMVGISMGFMVGATILSVGVPLIAKEVATFGDSPSADLTATSFASQPLATASTPSDDGLVGTITDGLGQFSEGLFRGRLTTFLVGPANYHQGLLCRCMLMALVIVLYHVCSLIAHLAAYRAGIATQATLTESALSSILHTKHPERVTVVNAVKLTQIITSSAKTCGDTLGAILTDVVSSAFAAIALLVALLYISATLTTIIAVMVLLVQYIYFVAGKHQDQRAAEVATEESSVQAVLSNAIQRSETISIFSCRSFILTQLHEKLGLVLLHTDRLNWSIHGYAAISSGATSLIFVVVLGLCNYFHRRGDIALTDIALFFLFLQQFVNRLLQLSKDVSRTRATLGRLATLQLMLEWYAEELSPTEPIPEVVEPFPLVPKPLPSVSHGLAKARVLVYTDPTSPIKLEHIDFTYPTVPAFFADNWNGESMDGGGVRVGCLQPEAGVSQPGVGIRDLSFQAAAGTITALYGPSGCGKSTCLRLLAGLARPHRGTVSTHKNVVLLEQQHAIFIGTVAENILLRQLHPPSNLEVKHWLPWDRRNADRDAQRAQYRKPDRTTEERIKYAIDKACCSSFLTDPFRTYIENVDHPPFSGGQLQRICLARVFAGDASCSLVLLDEPTTGLDAESVAFLLEAIKQLRDVHRKTVLISTHDDRVAEVCDRIIDLRSMVS